MAETRKFKDLFCSCFNDSRSWVNWFFSVIVQEKDIIGMSSEEGSQILSGALLQDYTFLYNGTELPSGYISCVATYQHERGKGLASEVMKRVLRQADERGMAVVSLIPAQRHLYGFYAHTGFSGVYYMNEERYLAGHVFEAQGREVTVNYALLHSVESAFGCGVIHSEDQFKYLMTDLNFNSGSCAIGAEDEDGRKAVLFAVYDTENPDAAIEVKALLAESRQAADMALKLLSDRVPDRGITVRTEPADASGPFLRAAGMARIIDVQAVLAALAENHPELKLTVTVHDDFIEKNNGTFSVRNGKCMPVTPVPKPDIDVDVRTLTSILFSSSAIGDIFNIPTHRPLMSMMLD